MFFIRMSKYQESIAVLDDLLKGHNCSVSIIPSIYFDCSALSLLNKVINELDFALSLAPAIHSEPYKDVIQATIKEVEDKSEKSPPETSQLTINDLDLRVGLIVDVSLHPSAEKLYCEDIDVGEDTPRKIASGLVPYYKLDEMKNRRVIVVCNLKPRSLVGFKSNGMVLCATHEESDGSRRVEFLDPPLSASIGDRVYGENISPLQSPLSVKQCDKQKAFAVLAPLLGVNSNGEGVWNGNRLVTGPSAVCTAPTLKDCPVS